MAALPVAAAAASLPSDRLHFVFPYYMLLQSHRAGSESNDDYNNLNNSGLMSAYYLNFTLLMRKAHEYAGQVVVQVEPDLVR
jgi:hypothetical protein